MTTKLLLGLGIVVILAFGIGFLYLIFVGIGPHEECECTWHACECTTVEGFELYVNNTSLIILSLIGLIVGDLFVLSYIFPIRHYTINKTVFWSIFMLVVSFLLVVLGFLIFYLIMVFRMPYIVEITPI